jgi:sugar lactone lactonase YvrE
VTRTASLFLVGCAATNAEDAARPAALLDTYVLSDAIGVPESVGFHDEQRSFYLGSLENGTVTRVDADGAETLLFTPDGAWLTLGVKVHPGTGDAWVCAVRDAGEPTATSELWVFADDGARTTLPLGDGARPHNCNDLAFDGDDTYITDRESGVVLRASLADGSGTIFAEHPLLEPSIIAQNGALITSGGDLLITKYAPAQLVRVPLDDPGSASLVTVDGDPLPSLPNGFDGAMWDGDTAVIAANDALVELTSADGWATATAVVTAPRHPIAAVVMAEGRRFGLKGEVVPWVLGLEPELPFELYDLDQD